MSEYNLELYLKNRDEFVKSSKINSYVITVNKYESYYKKYSNYNLLSLKTDNNYNLECYEKIFIKNFLKYIFNESIELSKEITKNNINYYYEGYFCIYNDNIDIKISYDALPEINKIINEINDEIVNLKSRRLK